MLRITDLRLTHNNLLGGYITDTKHVEGISLKNCDWLIIEYNHDEVVIEEDCNMLKIIISLHI